MGRKENGQESTLIGAVLTHLPPLPSFLLLQPLPQDVKLTPLHKPWYSIAQGPPKLASNAVPTQRQTSTDSVLKRNGLETFQKEKKKKTRSKEKRNYKKMQVMIRTLVILKDVTVLQSGGGANSNSSVTTEPLDLQCARHAGDCFSVCLSPASWASREAFTDDLTVTGVSAFLQKGKETLSSSAGSPLWTP